MIKKVSYKNLLTYGHLKHYNALDEVTFVPESVSVILTATYRNALLCIKYTKEKKNKILSKNPYI